MFNLWSETNPDAYKNLKPDLGLRSWDSLSENEKYLIWKHLDVFFFDIDNPKYDNQDYNHIYTNQMGRYFEFYDPHKKLKRLRVQSSINSMHKKYKVKNYTPNFARDYKHYSACIDFYHIFKDSEGDAVLELLSFYCKELLSERESYPRKPSDFGTIEDYENDKLNWEYVYFNQFAKSLNEVFGDFGLNIYLSKTGFLPKQDNYIMNDIYEPVLHCLIEPRWKIVNNILSDAFKEFRENTPNGYSSCVTHSVSAVQAFLQLLVNGNIGNGDISKLIDEAQRKKLIPNDPFTKEIFKKIESVLMRERQETGDPHPKKEYASSKNAKLVLNLTMVFFQHCLVE